MPIRSLSTETDERLGARSVLDPYHPNNCRRDHDDDGNYVYRTRRRSKKLNFTLGWELEANHVPSRFPNGVSHISDGSVNGDGAEFVVLPAVTKSPKYVLGLLKELVHAPRLNTDKSCGYHVHVSASNLTLREMREWAIATEHLAMMIEDQAFKAVPDARQGNSYCRRIRPITNGTSFQSRKYSNDRRYHWLNTVEMFRPGGIHTLENRLLGNTHRWKYLLAWSLFSMELARRGWELSLKPFDSNTHVDALTEMLQRIGNEIKPLDKRNEPIPQWVYEGLKTFDIPANAWDRPLAKLGETESIIKGLPKKYYSDNQETIENQERDEDDDNSCSCGCGEDGTCDSQTHSDGDCDSAYCNYCHEDGDCSGMGTCTYHIDEAHDNNESCGRSTCSTCQRRTAQRVSNITIHPSNTIEPRTGADVQAAVNELVSHEMSRPNVQAALNGAMRDQLLYGSTGNMSVWIDDATHLPAVSYEPIRVNDREWFAGPVVHPETLQSLQASYFADLEHRAMCMLNMQESTASIRRESDYNSEVI